jgi:hypothetical protein
MLIITIASCWIEVGNLGSQPNNKKYVGKDERVEVCQITFPFELFGPMHNMVSFFGC